MTFVKTALFHKAGEGSGGGGGGDQHNLGWYATESALTTAHPTATDGDWAIVGATDTVWVWDSDTTAWVDTGAAGIELPDQTGNSGKFLTTNGTAASWGNALQNSATGSHSMIIGDATMVQDTNNAVLIGYNARSYGNGAVKVGVGGLDRGNYNTCIGYENGVNLNVYGTINLGCGITATESQTLNVRFAGNTGLTGLTAQYKLLDSDGTIPTARFTTDPVSDGTYYPTLTISSGTPTRSWSTIAALQNTATSEDSLTILGTPSTSAAQKRSINIGAGSSVADSESVVIGRNATSDSSKTVNIGAGSQTHGIYGIAIGANAKTQATPTIAIGYGATASAVGAIMIGSNTNSEANTVKINSYKVLDADGTIPTARLTKVNSTITLATADWSGGSQTVTVNGVTATGVVLVSPDPTDQAAYTSAGIICTAQAADSLTFTATTTPSADIDVNVVML